MSISKVLIIDDEPDIRTIGAMALELVGKMKVRGVGSCDEAIVALQSERPDVILLDVMMPRIDGPTTLARLRELPGGREIPIIFMTAKVLKHEVDAYMKLGAVGVIGKPFDPMTLAREVQAIVERDDAPR